MFLDVSGPLVPMDISDSERTELGHMIRRQRERAYDTMKDAYIAGGVNQATWVKAETGGSVRSDKLRRIVRTLWPETEGDWTLIMSSHGPTLEERVEALERQLRRLKAAGDQDDPAHENPDTAQRLGGTG